MLFWHKASRTPTAQLIPTIVVLVVDTNGNGKTKPFGLGHDDRLASSANALLFHEDRQDLFKRNSKGHYLILDGVPLLPFLSIHRMLLKDHFRYIDGHLLGVVP